MALAAADELRQRILSGEFPEGFQLKQDALAEDFGMSPIPIREALVQLDSEGFVRILPHRGAQVSALSRAEISELFELRALLEPRILRLSAPHLTAEDYAAFDRIQKEYRAEIRAMNPGRWGELNTRLHLQLLSRAERPRTLAIVTALLQNADRYTRLQLSLTGSGRTRAEKEHAMLVRLCRAGDVTAACKLLTAHIRHAEAELVAFISARGSTSKRDPARKATAARRAEQR
jgi:DNA-binding GntR family transcriptional regulator